MRLSVVLLSLAIGGTAFAKGETKPLVDAARAFADESRVFISIGNQGDGYSISASAEVGGIHKDDRVRLDVKQNGKLLETIQCSIRARADVIKSLDAVNCGDNKELKATGALQADLVLESDADDKQFLLRTFNVTAKKWGTPDWGLDSYDDLLGNAYIVQNTEKEEKAPQILFWASAAPDGGAPTLVCNVGGKALPEIEGAWDNVNGTTIDIIKGKGRTTWNWIEVRYQPQTYGGDNFKPFEIEKYPGAWDCLLKRKGVVLREFKFTVDAKGKVQPHAMQAAKGAPTLAPEVSQIEVTIPKGNGFDQRIKPDAIKKGRGFGMPWQQHDSVKAMLAALPPALETQDPKVDQKKTGGGKVIDGSTLNPPRFIDESSTYIFLTNTSNGGYGIRAHAAAANITFAKGNIFHLLWKQNGKVLTDADCSWSRDGGMGKFGMMNASDLSCASADDVSLKATGAIEAQLLMTDDADNNDYLLRTYKVNVIHPKSWGDPVWAILPDDTLGAAWIAGNSKGAGHILFRYWAAGDVPDPEMARCTVDGKKVPDLEFGGGDDLDIEYVVRKQGSDDKKYHWKRLDLAANKHGDVGPGMPDKDDPPDELRALGKFPGNWVCDLRRDGKVLRTISFHVNKEGYVDPSSSTQAGELTIPDVVPVDIKFGKDATDTRVRPDAIKKSAGWGRPWPKGPPKDLPKAGGLPDPK